MDFTGFHFGDMSDHGHHGDAGSHHHNAAHGSGHEAHVNTHHSGKSSIMESVQEIFERIFGGGTGHSPHLETEEESLSRSGAKGFRERVSRFMKDEKWLGKKGLAIGGTAVALGAVVYGVHKATSRETEAEPQSWAKRVSAESKENPAQAMVR
jgi:hypothetical protein